MVLIEEIAHRLFARPTAVAPVPATFPGPFLSAHPVFRRIACRPILPAAVPAVVCPSPGSIDFAPAGSAVAADSAGFVVAVADSDFVVDCFVAGSVAAVVAAGSVVSATPPVFSA